MSMLQEFKEFAVKGNAMDLAVGVIIGGAFGKIVDSIVGDLIMPVVLTLWPVSMGARSEAEICRGAGVDGTIMVVTCLHGSHCPTGRVVDARSTFHEVFDELGLLARRNVESVVQHHDLTGGSLAGSDPDRNDRQFGAVR